MSELSPEVFTFAQFINWGFLLMLSALAAWIAKSISDLNVKIAVIIERTESHENRIKHLESRN